MKWGRGRECFAVSLGMAGALWASPLSAAVQEERPNFLFIFTDDQAWPQVSVPMNPALPHSACSYLDLPHMARLAMDGMRFTDGYAPSPICTPSRRSILCGMTPARQRGTEFASSFDPREHLTIPLALKAVDARYRCAHFGKWGENMVASPGEVGYDVNDGITGNHTGDFETWEEKLHRQREGRRLPKIAAEPLEDPKRSFSVTQRAAAFMRRQTELEHPFFVQVSYYAPHDQIQARAESLAKFEEKGTPPRDFPFQYAAMLKDLDACVGQLLATIDELGIADNTYVFLSSDNGGTQHRWNNPFYLAQLRGDISAWTDEGEPALPEDAGASFRLPDNYPLRGAKQWLFEGGIRVPFLVRGPGIRPGAIQSEPVVLYDLLPTLVDLAGGDVSALPDDIDGGSLKPALRETGPVNRALPGLVFHRPILEFRDGRTVDDHRGWSAFRSGDLKLVVDLVADEKALYDVREDPGETRDLSSARAEEAERLYRILMDYLEAVDAETVGARTLTMGLRESRPEREQRIRQLQRLSEKALEDGRSILK